MIYITINIANFPKTLALTYLYKYTFQHVTFRTEGIMISNKTFVKTLVQNLTYCHITNEELSC